MSPTTATITILVLGTLIPALIHLGGWDQTKTGQILTSILLDLVGAYKAAKVPKDDDDSEDIDVTGGSGE